MLLPSKKKPKHIQPPPKKKPQITNKSQTKAKPTNQNLKQFYSSRNLSTTKIKTAWILQLRLLLNRLKPEVEALVEASTGDTITGREDPTLLDLLSLKHKYSTQNNSVSTQHSWDSRKIMKLHFNFYVTRLFQAKGVQKLDSIIFVGSFQLRIFNNSMKSI